MSKNKTSFGFIDELTKKPEPKQAHIAELTNIHTPIKGEPFAEYKGYKVIDFQGFYCKTKKGSNKNRRQVLLRLDEDLALFLENNCVGITNNNINQLLRYAKDKLQEENKALIESEGIEK